MINKLANPPETPIEMVSPTITPIPEAQLEEKKSPFSPFVRVD